MTGRCAILLLGGRPADPPPGIDAAAYLRALAEDVADLLQELREVETVVVTSPAARELAGAVVWPGTPVIAVPEATPFQAFAAAAALGYREAVVVPGDVPDLPHLVIAKLFKALAHSAAAAAPCHSGGLAALAARLPAPSWLAAADLDASLDGLRAAAPSDRDVAASLGWRRLRSPTDVAALDPELEGWEATRALLGAGGSVSR